MTLTPVQALHQEQRARSAAEEEASQLREELRRVEELLLASKKAACVAQRDAKAGLKVARAKAQAAQEATEEEELGRLVAEHDCERALAAKRKARAVVDAGLAALQGARTQRETLTKRVRSQALLCRLRVFPPVHVQVHATMQRSRGLSAAARPSRAAKAK
jgi:hypothetical protein